MGKQAISNSSNKEVLNNLQSINLTFKDIDVDYLNIVSWLKNNIGLEKVKPLIVNIHTPDNIDSSINKVMNIIRGSSFNGTLNLEKTEIINDVPSKTKVEVTLL